MLVVGLVLTNTGAYLTCIGIFEINPTFSVFLVMTSYGYFRFEVVYNWANLTPPCSMTLGLVGDYNSFLAILDKYMSTSAISLLI